MKDVISNGLCVFLKRVTKHLEKKFSFTCRSIRLMHPSEDGWGSCENGHIAIKIINKNQIMPLEEIFDSLAHELAHIQDTQEGNHHDGQWAKRYKEYRDYLGI